MDMEEEDNDEPEYELVPEDELDGEPDADAFDEEAYVNAKKIGMRLEF